MSTTTVGTCGRCGGRVSVPTMWGSTLPPIPMCDSCGARVKQPWGPPLEMEAPAPKREFTLEDLEGARASLTKVEES